MPPVQKRGTQILDEGITRSDLNVSTPGSAVIRKIIAGTNITISQTGADAGTGDVTINASGSGQSALQFQEESANLGAAGTVDTINVKGDNILASRAGNVLTLEAKTYKRMTQALSQAASANLGVLGITVTATGTATLFTPAPTSIASQQLRVDYLVTTAAATAVAGFRGSNGMGIWRGNGAGLGGFRFRCRWTNATGAATATNRCFVGLRNSTGAPTDVEPSTLLNMIGMGWDAADANIQLMSNDGAGVATKTDLGASFAVPATDRSAVYEIELVALPNDTVITYKITNVVNGAVATGTVSADLPASNGFLAPLGYMSVGGTSSVIGIGLCWLTIESDY
jgi:hypothetical protein